jgi:murein L,D-transpeptidase YcbB/YkuD
MAAHGAQAAPAQEIEAAVRGQPELVELYATGQFAPLWTDADHRLTLSARDAIRLLKFAPADGLNPDDYNVARLELLTSVLESRTGRGPADGGDAGTTPGSQAALASFDVRLSEAVLAFLHHVRAGRVDPPLDRTAIEGREDSDADLPAALRRAIAERQLVAMVAARRPRGPEYAAMMVALARYRELALHEPSPQLPFQKSVHPGEAYDALRSLHARLMLLGDLSADVAAPGDLRYDGPILDAVKRFQRRHSLEADGILGKQTVDQLNVPLSWRVRQIELAMERLRWLPRQSDQRLVLVNIPMFRLAAWDTIPPAGAPSFSTRVIVGQARRTKTPTFAAMMKEILFRPYWNVPRSILRSETLPALAKQPDYLARNEMEIVAGDRDDSPVVSATPENLALLARGGLRLRQRPGPKNALGLIKFSFPNVNDVYMHDTPARSLFARSRRDFSHGCIRVENPIGLAEWMLAEQVGWDRARIAAAMTAPASSRVTVDRPVRVILFYSTAAMEFETGDIAFADDIYERDAALDRAMREPLKRLRLPEPDAASVDVDEVGRGIETDAAASGLERGASQLRERYVGETDVDRLPLQVQASGRDPLGVLTQHLVGLR